MKKLYIFFFVIFNAYAQNPADRDPTFNTFSLPLGSHFIDYNILKAGVQQDGKIIFLKSKNTGGTELIRLDKNILDTSFNTGTGFKYAGYNFKIQTDGKIIAIGYFTSYNSVGAKNIVRLNTDGSVDKSFVLAPGVTISGTSEDNIPDVAIQPDGKILISGILNAKGGVIRLNNDGSLDNSFTAFTAIDAGVTTIRLQTDGKIIVAGVSTGGNKIFRINKDGSLDIDLTPVLDKITVQYDIASQKDGKILFSAAFEGLNNTNNVKLLRLNNDGTIDSSFNTNSIGVWDARGIAKIIIQPDGKIILGGKFIITGSNSNGIIRLNSDGTIDTTFKTGTGVDYQINDLDLLPNGKVLVSGQFNKFNKEVANYVIILNSDGTKDSSFNNAVVGFDYGQVTAVTILPDDKILAAGTFFSYNAKTITNGMVRLNSDGSLDESLTFGGVKGFSDQYMNFTVNSIAVQKDGKMVAGGGFQGFNNITTNRIVRLNYDGSRDNSFVIGTGFDYDVHKVVVLADNKILVAGDFKTYNGNTALGLVRLNSNGSLDTTFKATWQGMNDSPLPYVSDIIVLADGKILMSSSAYKANKGLARLNTDGSEDTSFVLDPIVKPNGSGAFVQSDGKIILSFKKNNTNGFFRLNPNGSLDNSFNYTPIDSEYYVTFVTGMQPDDKILVSGYSTQNNKNRFFARLKLDGSYDETFTNLFHNSDIDYTAKIVPQSNGKLIYSGGFINYRGIPAGRIIRLLGQDYKFVQGQNKLDSDNNGCDLNDIAFANLKLDISSDQNTTSYIANSTGNYTVTLKNGFHTLTPVFENPSYFNVVPASIAVDFPSQVSPHNGDFCISPKGMHPDLEVTILPLTPARPGFDAKYKIVFTNKGNQQLSGSVSFDYMDDLIDVLQTTPNFSSQSQNNLKWDFSNLRPLETREISFVLNINSPMETPPVNGGMFLKYSAKISSLQTDETPNNNSFAFDQIVVNSFDPNDKTCIEGNVISQTKVGDYVHYIIRFENTGTYTAQNIIVKDVIDTAKYDINSLSPLSGSHLFSTEISDNNKVEFKFKDINLPFDDANNDGYLAFKIKTKATLVEGDTFGNSANIFFDYNSTITTNVPTTTISKVLGVQDFSFSKYFVLYPNPVNGTLNINTKDDIELSTIQIYNILGQLIMVVSNANNINNIDVSTLMPGTYFIKIVSDRGTSNTKFIKK
ncbi:T9SS type A sorting domain-containing protein [Flavobacterium sp. N3904]|uniref:DUF7619 domain-containing protein n=1 Tax=Flavobacterium sp. N3904 TaxID=2986835 RepID=UPI0022242A0B|nr:T9SS type A sorting domain-containing protein [Flavobacterium sp. N3904]